MDESGGNLGVGFETFASRAVLLYTELPVKSNQLVKRGLLTYLDT